MNTRYTKTLTTLLILISGVSWVFLHTNAWAGAVGESYTISPPSQRWPAHPKVAMNRDGRSVVIWPEYDNGHKLWGQVYDRNRSPVGDLLSIEPMHRVGSGRVAMDSKGNFVVVWSGPTEGQLWYRLYNASGAPWGQAKQVIPDTPLSVYPSVAMDDQGNFVIVWVSINQDKSGVYARLFSPHGLPKGEAFQVSTSPLKEFMTPVVKMSRAGSFIVAWSGGKRLWMWGNNDVMISNLYARQYDADGRALRRELQLTSDTNKAQYLSDVVQDQQGNFAVFWLRETYGLEAYLDEGRLLAQFHDHAGFLLKASFPIDSSSNYQHEAQAVIDDNRHILVGWWSNGFIGQWLNPDGTPRGKKFLFNPPDIYPASPSLATDGNGTVMAVWQTLIQSGNSTGTGPIRGRRFAFNTVTTVRSSLNPAPPGQFVTLTAEVSSEPGASVPTGMVRFLDGDSLLGIIPLDTNGRATFHTIFSGGTHAITAAYESDDTYFNSSGSLPGGQTNLSGGAPFPPGDVTQDGIVTISDAVLLLRHLAGIHPLTTEVIAVADVNGDNTLNVSDAVNILRISVGLTHSA